MKSLVILTDASRGHLETWLFCSFLFLQIRPPVQFLCEADVLQGWWLLCWYKPMVKAKLRVCFFVGFFLWVVFFFF